MPGKRFIHSQQYHKAELFEEIQELYKVACLTYGYSLQLRLWVVL